MPAQELHDQGLAHTVWHFLVLPAKPLDHLFGEVDLEVLVGHGVLLV
jgi:hypothetical protein